MIRKILPAIILIALISFSSCNDELDRINEDPNATPEAFAPYLLTGSLKHGADLYWGTDNNLNSSLLFIQHWAKIQYTEADRYDLSNSSFTTLWDKGYATLIKDLNSILELPEDKANANYKGVALALRSWTYLLMTDVYGEIPYEETGKSVTPAYDSQKNIYLGLLSDLDAAQNLLQRDKGNISGDLVYNGDIAKWKKFVNALKLRIALRISDREPELAKQVITKISTDQAGLISNNEETFRFVYTKSPQQNPAAKHFETRDDYRISKTIVDKLYELSDPRLPVYAQLPTDSALNAQGRYVGAANGLSNSAASNQGLAKTSKPGAYFLKSESPAVIFSYSEVLFGLSEAVARGFISGNAEEYYNKAITASFNQFGVTDTTVIKNYLNQPKVKFDRSNFKKSIGEQKWIAFFGQGLDAFAEWRRLDYPQLKAGPNNVLDNRIPIRFFYPGTEQSLNRKNYQQAIKNQGADLLTTRLWFDIN